MFLPRSTFQLTFVCLTLFSSLLWISSYHVGSGSNSPTFLSGHRAPTPPPCSVHANVVVDEPAHDPIWDVQNRTLGFQKIFAISMPHRTDKRDYLALMGHISELDIEFIDGVNGSLIHPHAIPSNWYGDNGPGTYGCWRAHLDIYQRMLQEGIQSALVLEDDADWDILFKAQMTEFARGTRHITNATLPMHSPYGDDWDLLTIGHTGVDNNPGLDQTYWVTKNDPTVIAEKRRTWGRKPDLSAPTLGGDHTRVVHGARKLTGTASYAISLRGASRVLYDQAMLMNAQAIDTALSNMCRLGKWGPNFCIGAYPMIVGRYRAAGPRDKDSDRRAETNTEQGHSLPQSKAERFEPESEFTVFPVSLNIERLMRNELIIPANAPESDLVDKINLHDFVLPRGGPVFVRQNEYASKEKSPPATPGKRVGRSLGHSNS